MTFAAAHTDVGKRTEDAAPAEQPAQLPHQMIEEGARRLALLAAVLSGTVVGLYIFHRVVQPEIAPLLDDPVNRLALLSSVLMGGALFALHHYKAIPPRMLLQCGMLFEVAVAFAIGMIETARPFASNVPLLGLSAVGPWLVFAGAVIPSRPIVRLGVALAAATMWPLAYAINSTRFGFVTESWRQTSIWPSMNYLFAFLSYMVGRWTYGTVRAAQSARDLGSYKLMSPIGEGGMGEVWRASHKMLARPAAIKLVKTDAGGGDLFAMRFYREANSIASLQSPHTVYLYDFGTTREGRMYYVMELLDGISLQTLVTTFGEQSPSRVVAILKQICRSLDEAHGKKIVHRDLKPSNVMICQVAQVFDFVKVLDFGLAKPFGTADVANLTVEGMTVGTPEYMAPEVARSSRKVDARADLYALGCVAYFLVSGSLVFPEANAVASAIKHMSTPPEPPSKRTKQAIPGDLEGVILKCLEKDPTARPASAREVERMLDACDVPPWTEKDAAAWWVRHLPPTSALRSTSKSETEERPAVQKAR